MFDLIPGWHLAAKIKKSWLTLYGHGKKGHLLTERPQPSELASSGAVPSPFAWAQGQPASLKGGEPPLRMQLLLEMAGIRFV